ncbi:hypothetical protein GOODEAATRI_004064 [Goodea atripinnis]|uniref:Uncharacterized protein n=1 Tax=Goodea atripinnis TaxID=208336 RepID=A0ABV0PL63_9TELE
MMTRSHLCGKVQEWQGASGSGDLWGRLSYCGEDRRSSQQLACGRNNGSHREARMNGKHLYLLNALVLENENLLFLQSRERPGEAISSAAPTFATNCQYAPCRYYSHTQFPETPCEVAVMPPKFFQRVTLEPFWFFEQRECNICSGACGLPELGSNCYSALTEREGKTRPSVFVISEVFAVPYCGPTSEHGEETDVLDICCKTKSDALPKRQKKDPKLC